ncbi:hypothetical protein GQ55_4G034000 [Panicum hallii var. hallii]|uniref:Leucine-rich repeat-containing N-terminal plant-type domain-containing protein n=1 Tax=Panicum hallii var. hallii TaxID=1504633 RepID=A0A2T7DUV6_9POAL|nr:hypothetical protein GQ55_4G034000 [Panicum hallii var. hallii]
MQPLNLPCSSSSNSKLLVPFFGLVFVLLLSSASHVSSCTEQERSSLIDFRDGLSPEGNGGLNVSWINNTDCCQWEGIFCSTDGVVTDVLLGSKGLKGSIPPSLSNLTGLLRLNLSRNSLEGSLPAELLFSNSIIVLDVSFNYLSGPLQERWQSSNPGLPLQVLNISSNLFKGQFPSTTLEVMKNLVALNASNNSFTGSMPSSICNYAPSIAMLDLCLNKFSGTISPEFANCSMLKVLKAGHNNLTGALPHELFNATSLEQLSFPNNDLQGILDASNLVRLNNLIILDVGSNGLRGNIPDSIGQLSRLEELHLDNNLMSGELPSALGNCTGLRYITIRNNSFKGDLSRVNFSRLDLRTADFSMNNFTDALQKLKSCSTLTSLLIGTNFNGETIPQDEAIDGFGNLQVLTIDACPLVGKIPLWLSKLTKLEMLDLSNNQLTGLIPSWINNLQLLFYLDISNNSLTGDIPIALMNMSMIQYQKNAVRLDPKFLELPVYWTPTRQYRMLNAFPVLLNIGHNRFTGSIPPEIGQLKMLDVLNFSSNNLSGEIPWQISNLTSLQVLDLSNNQLTATVGTPSYVAMCSTLHVTQQEHIQPP